MTERGAPGYPIPANEKVLRTEHLRGLALFAVQHAGLGLGAGRYGFFRPAFVPMPHVNVVSYHRGQARVEGLAVLTRDGVAVIGNPEPLSVNADRPFTLVARWKVPQFAPDDKPVPAQISLGLEDDKSEFDAEVELAHISPGTEPDVRLRAPLMSVDGTDASAAAAGQLRDTMGKLAEQIEVAGRQNPATRALVGASLRAAARSVDPSPLAMLDRVALILCQCAAIVRLEEGRAFPLVGELETSSSALTGADDGTWPASNWIDWISHATTLLEMRGDLATWLRGAHRILARSRDPEHKGGAFYWHNYVLDGVAEDVRLTVKGSHKLESLIKFRLDGGAEQNLALESGGDGLAGRIVVAGAKQIDILAPEDAELVLLY
jgi:hypothetical protein